MSKRTIAVLSTAFVSLFLTACGGGGTDPTPPVETPTVVVVPPVVLPPALTPPVVMDATLTMQGLTIEVRAGDTFSFLVPVNCPRFEATGTRCSKVVGPMTVSINAPGVSVDMIQYQYNGNVVDAGAPWSITDAGAIQVSARVLPSATVGQSAEITMTATSAGLGTVEVVGVPITITVVSEAAKLANISPYLFSRVGYGEIAGFDLPCPADTAPQGCSLNGMNQTLVATGTPISVGVQIDTFVGAMWWWQLETGPAIVNGSESYSLFSPIKVPAGQTVRISVRSDIAQGCFSFTRVDFVRVSDGSAVPFLLPPAPAVCITSVQPLETSFGACKG